jgi:hypothetical protein
VLPGDVVLGEDPDTVIDVFVSAEPAALRTYLDGVGSDVLSPTLEIVFERISTVPWGTPSPLASAAEGGAVARSVAALNAPGEHGPAGDLPEVAILVIATLCVTVWVISSRGRV